MKLKRDTPLRLAKWTFVFKQNSFSDVALYHSLNVDVVFLERKFEGMVEWLRKGTTVNNLTEQYDPSQKEAIGRIIKEMWLRGLIIEATRDDLKLLQQKRREVILPIGLLGMYLMLTDECNLRCKYCFINQSMPSTYKRSGMIWQVAKQAVDMYFRNIVKNPEAFRYYQKTISFYGGEPLLNFPLIRKIIEYTQATYTLELKEMDPNFQYALVTNGTLITKEIADFLAQHKEIAIGISIDGKKDIHNQKRIYRSGRGSFDRAIRGCDLLRRAGCTNISISCTVDTHNIDELKSLLELQKEYGFTSINLNLLLDTEEERVSLEYMKRASIRILEYFECAREKGVYEERVMRKVKSFISHKIHAFDCQATGNQVVCSPSGQIGVCHEGIGLKNFFFANISSDFDFHNNPILKEWSGRSPLTMPQCFDCPAIGICGGGCAYGAYLRNGSIWSVDDRFCVHSLETLEWMIWDLYKTF